MYITRIKSFHVIVPNYKCVVMRYNLFMRDWTCLSRFRAFAVFIMFMSVYHNYFYLVLRGVLADQGVILGFSHPFHSSLHVTYCFRGAPIHLLLSHNHVINLKILGTCFSSSFFTHFRIYPCFV